MKRDWNIIKAVLEHVEVGDTEAFYASQRYLTDLGIDEDIFLGHVEILLDAGILKGGEVRRSAVGTFMSVDLRGAFITMYGHDLLDALRDKTVWNQIRAKAVKAGVSLSWEFIKAALPLVIQDLAR